MAILAIPRRERMPVLRSEVRVLQTAPPRLFRTEMSISTRARRVEPVRSLRTAAEGELRIRAPLLFLRKPNNRGEAIPLRQAQSRLAAFVPNRRGCPVRQQQFHNLYVLIPTQLARGNLEPCRHRCLRR